jgi:hypothetical protein
VDIDTQTVIKRLWTLLKLKTKIYLRDNQGFLTSLNRYVDRKEGWIIAKKNKQIQWGLEASENGEDSALISENLY